MTKTKKKKKKLILEVIGDNKFECIFSIKSGRTRRYVIEKQNEKVYLVTEYSLDWENWVETGVTWNAEYIKELIDTFEGMM